MAVYEIFSRPLAIKYKTSLCSKATWFSVLTSLLTLICPFLITYYSQGFWKKYDIYREQPNVAFKHKMLLVLETKSPKELIFWSTYKSLNQLVDAQTSKITPTIEHREDDFNMDGKRDRLQMLVQVPLTRQEIHSVKLILVFDYKMDLHSSFRMESAAYVQHSSPLPGAALSTFGELAFHQRVPLSHAGHDMQYDNPVVDTSKSDLPSTRLENILLSYVKRNITTSFYNVHSVWETGRARNESFRINLFIYYPEVTILYRCGFWQLIKWGLVQYMAVFVIISALVGKLKSYVFEMQLLNCIVINPAKKNS